jgi:hypothetical protein
MNEWMNEWTNDARIKFSNENNLFKFSNQMKIIHKIYLVAHMPTKVWIDERKDATQQHGIVG